MAKKPKTTTTKELKGKRVGGVLYLGRGVGTGRFTNSGSVGSGTVTSYAPTKSRRDDY